MSEGSSARMVSSVKVFTAFGFLSVSYGSNDADASCQPRARVCAYVRKVGDKFDVSEAPRTGRNSLDRRHRLAWECSTTLVGGFRVTVVKRRAQHITEHLFVTFDIASVQSSQVKQRVHIRFEARKK